MQITVAASKKKELSEAQKEYRKFFHQRVKDAGKEHAFEGTGDEIADFLLNLTTDWEEHKAKNNIKTKAEK